METHEIAAPYRIMVRLSPIATPLISVVANDLTVDLPGQSLDRTRRNQSESTTRPLLK